MSYSTDSSSSPQINRALLDKAALLRHTSLFVDVSDGTRLQQQLLFLVLAGEKPVAEVSSGHWEVTPGGRRTVADDPEAVASFLTELGLAYELRLFDDHATDALVALDPDLLEQYRQAEAANDLAAIGRLFGYPETAVTAFGAADADEQLLDPEEQDQRTRAAGLDSDVVTFRLSKTHWADELATVQRWQALLVAGGLDTPATDVPVAA